MVLNYPNGQPFKRTTPVHKKKKSIEFGKRGMSFEEEINQTNEYYLSHDLAVVHKKPTPVQIVSVDYPKRSAAVITEAYFRHASTTDYNGVYKGRYLDFEAKETKNKTSFPLQNFHEHQINHMKQCLKQKGICFVLIWFSSLGRCFFLDAANLIRYWDQTKKKSMPLKWIEEHSYEIKPGIAPRIPYLDAIDNFILKEKQDGTT